MTAGVNTEQAEYDRRWGADDINYGGQYAGYTPHFLAFMKKHASTLSSGEGKRALEIGCGDGFFSKELFDMGFGIAGVDLSPVGVEKSKERCPEGEFRVHDLNNPLPFDDASFDVTWCSEVLEHLFAPLVALQEIERVLRPGGLALFTVPFHGLLKNVAIAIAAFEKHYDPEYPHIQYYTKKSLTKIVEKAGFRLEEVSHCGSNLSKLRDTVFPTNILLAARKPA